MDIDRICRHIRDREYMSGIERNAARIKAAQEIFTPTPMVQHILDKLDPTFFGNPDQTFVDPTCGDGQFLGEVLIRKMQRLCEHRDYIIKSQESIGETVTQEQRQHWFEEDFRQSLSTLYGVDFMPDNVKLCQDRLLCGQEHLRHIVEQNIVCADALRYHYRFDGSDPYETDEDRHFSDLFQFS
jgi:hypothetical protein